MNRHHATLSLACLFVAGCAVDLGSGLSLDTFDKSPDAIDVSAGDDTVNCDLTITTTGLPVLDAGCVFQSLSGHEASCLATSAVGNVWTCTATVLQSSEAGTWTIDYVFARDTAGAKVRATGAELVADAANVLEGDATRVDLAVTSTSEDTTPPTLLTFDAAFKTVFTDNQIDCTVTTDEDPVQNIGCTFIPDDDSGSISCLSHGSDSCSAYLPDGVLAGTIYREVNHFARDAALNLSIGYNSKTVYVIDPSPTGTIQVDMSALPAGPPTADASWTITPDPGGGNGSGTTSLGPFDAAVDATGYTITWEDTAFAYTAPATEGPIPLASDGSIVFDLAPNYVVRPTRAVNVDASKDGGSDLTGITAAWDINAAAPFGVSDLDESGAGDEIPVVLDGSPVDEAFYDGRDYEISWTPEAGYTTPLDSTVTAQVADQTFTGNFVSDDCSSKSPDLSIVGVTPGDGDWSASQSQTAAPADLTFTTYARSTTAGTQSIVAISDRDITVWADAPMLVRFFSNGFIDARDGANYGCGTGDGDAGTASCGFPWVAGTWYKITVTADIVAERYTVSVGACDDTPDIIITDAHFRPDPLPLDAGGVDRYAIWADGTTMSVEGVTWSTTCTPLVCADYGPASCGTPPDGCGGTLASCGTCSAPADVCDDGFQCCDTDESWCTNNGKDCDTWTDNCDQSVDCGDINCGDGAGGDVCNDGVCCTPSTTVCTDPNPDYECGDWDDTCGGTVNCGSCGGGDVCNVDGQCVVPTNWWELKTEPDATNTGPNCSAPGCPSTALTDLGSCSNVNTSTPGTTIENFECTGGFRVQSSNVTLRNFRVNKTSASTFGISVNAGISGGLWEYGEIDGNSTGGDCIRGRGFTGRFLHVHGCNDTQKVGGDNQGPLIIENSYYHDACCSHSDAFQVWGDTDSAVTVRDSSITCGGTACLITSAVVGGIITFNNNWLYGGGNNYIYCGWDAGDVGPPALYITNNLFDRNYTTLAPGIEDCVWTGNLYMDDFTPAGPP